jgi:hypothetical protein
MSPPDSRDNAEARPLWLDELGLDFGLGEMRRTGHRADLPQRLEEPGPAPVAHELHYNHIGHFAAAGRATPKAIF